MNNGRGVRIFANLLKENASLGTNIKKTGRSKELIKQRNDLLLHRFYFKVKIERKNYEDTIDELHTEFHLSKMQVQRLIGSNGDEILAIKKEAPTVKALQIQWKFINWK